jgi:hypothetical protein
MIDNALRAGGHVAMPTGLDWLPFAYFVELKSGRKGLGRHVVVERFATEIAERPLPVAFRVMAQFGDVAWRQDGDRLLREVVDTQNERILGASNFAAHSETRPFQSQHQYDPEASDSPIALPTDPERGYRIRFGPQREPVKNGTVFLGRDAVGKLGADVRVSSDDRASRLADAMAKAAELAVCAGKVLKPAPPPKWAVELHNDMAVTMRPVVPEYFTPGLPTMLFPITHQEDAAEFAEWLAERTGDHRVQRRGDLLECNVTRENCDVLMETVANVARFVDVELAYKKGAGITELNMEELQAYGLCRAIADDPAIATPDVRRLAARTLLKAAQSPAKNDQGWKYTDEATGLAGLWVEWAAEKGVDLGQAPQGPEPDEDQLRLLGP